ncbi:hypothetical protein LINPERPRIM_LOCUS566 [Linum perenne]
MRYEVEKNLMRKSFDEKRGVLPVLAYVSGEKKKKERRRKLKKKAEANREGGVFSVLSSSHLL